MMHEGAKPILFQRAQDLRKRETEAEKVLWEKLSNKQLGVKFRRQHPLYRFVVDFYCHELRLVVEVDGSVHDSSEQTEYDEFRTMLINQLDIKVIRFRNDEVFNELDKVLEIIRQHILPRS
ncbi:Very-short-patch-repair endonuclease [Dyadobacter soli]|uniref:Very-short-patch-repair endonuclease n=1 Tax=Dyadobacter soli TaxID=659014 RepID=A0A1G7YJ76_9BACT|nr:endonuclease domain-containing protein [Dyadobacter soli]SDG96591.1 Very-short-patch-repair endonuclease [Dyadobacter soli]